MSTTSDPNDPRLGHGPDDHPAPMNDVYLVLSEQERAKGFVRPLRRSYRHVGPPGPEHELMDLSPEQLEQGYDDIYVKYEPYPPGSSTIGRYWSQAQLDAIGKGCGAETHMGLALCETYARDPLFYGSTYCIGCSMHRPVSEFVWVEDGQRVGS